jgi:hypothetical protein
MISKILTGNFFWIVFFLFIATSVQARNEYLNNGTNTCAQGSFDVSIEQREDQYNYNHYSPSNNYENTEDDRSVRLTWRKYLGTACTDESSNFVGDRDFDPKVSYWTVLKEQYMKENPDIITLDNYKK